MFRRDFPVAVRPSLDGHLERGADQGVRPTIPEHPMGRLMAELDILRDVKSAKKPRRKNPSTAAKVNPIPFLDPDYPLKPWVAHTGERFQTVSVSLDDGKYLAFILENPNIRHTAKTRSAAEDAVKKAYPPKPQRNPRDIPYDDEEAFMDDEDYRIGQERIKRGKFLTLEQFRERMAKRLGRRSR